MVEAVAADEVDVLPVQGREVGPHGVGNGVSVLGEVVGGCGEVAGVPDDDGVYCQARDTQCP
jgi:hypothetical protein